MGLTQTTEVKFTEWRVSTEAKEEKIELTWNLPRPPTKKDFEVASTKMFDAGVSNFRFKTENLDDTIGLLIANQMLPEGSTVKSVVETEIKNSFKEIGLIADEIEIINPISGEIRATCKNHDYNSWVENGGPQKLLHHLGNEFVNSLTKLDGSNLIFTKHSVVGSALKEMSKSELQNINAKAKKLPNNQDFEEGQQWLEQQRVKNLDQQLEKEKKQQHESKEKNPSKKIPRKK